MNTETLFGSIALTASILLTCLGLPSQIVTTYRLKSSRGLSAPLMVISFLTYCAWFFYGLVKTPADNFLLLANVPGMLFGGIIIGQILHYRGSNRKP